MFFLADDKAATATDAVTRFDPFDLFMIAFTVILVWGVFRSLKTRPQNKFAIGFGVLALLVFLALDMVMVMHWINPA
ncbi:hypothetical protein [Gorillibacterium massiliense]|uniref:hypothetical protein n=1 Tax=Gorillibacterium massiliense TaxID=1280390 RepID=UPI0004B79890|nr:hypothetical protein [Gorillibacterium massiliense]